LGLFVERLYNVSDGKGLFVTEKIMSATDFTFSMTQRVKSLTEKTKKPPKSIFANGVASGLWPEVQGFQANLSGHSPDTTYLAKVST